MRHSNRLIPIGCWVVDSARETVSALLQLGQTREGCQLLRLLRRILDRAGHSGEGSTNKRVASQRAQRMCTKSKTCNCLESQQKQRETRLSPAGLNGDSQDDQISNRGGTLSARLNLDGGGFGKSHDPACGMSLGKAASTLPRYWLDRISKFSVCKYTSLTSPLGVISTTSDSTSRGFDSCSPPFQID